MNKSIAIITARGGSKRIPKKNIKEFCGMPIITYSIQAALLSEIFDEVMVSTDDEEIARVSKEYGAAVPFLRSERTSNDYATTAEVINEVLKEYGEEYDRFCCIYPTAPFIKPELLRKGMNMLEKYEAVLPVVSYSFPPQRALHIRNGKVEFVFPKNENVRSQDLEKIYHDSGQFYCFRRDSFEKSHSMIIENMAPIVVSELEVQDIDNESDWKLAEIKYRMLMDDDKNSIINKVR